MKKNKDKYKNKNGKSLDEKKISKVLGSGISGIQNPSTNIDSCGIRVPTAKPSPITAYANPDPKERSN